MKVSSDELALLRTLPQRSQVYLGVERGVTLLTAQVDGDQAEGATSILLKNVVCADVTDLRKGMTISFATNIGNDRKTSAMFVAYNSGTQVLTIGPNAEALGDNAYVFVYSRFYLWKTDPGTFPGTQPAPPFAVMGPPRAGFVNEPLSFIGANSYSPVGRAIAAGAWKFFDAHHSIAAGSTAALNDVGAPLVVAWDTPGEYLGRLKVTDADGEVGSTYRPILMFERTGDNAPYTKVKVNSCAFGGSGWTASFTVYGNADEDAFPPQARVILWADDWYGDTPGSLGGCLRGNSEVLFTGWIREGTVKVSSEEQSVSFTADSIEMLMQKLTLPSLTFRDGNDTTDWVHFDDLTLAKAAAHIIQQRTTLETMADVFLALFEFQLDTLDVPEASLYDQLNQSIVPACFGYVAGSRFASVTVARMRNMLDSDQRAELKRAAISLTAQDWLNLEIMEKDGRTAAQVRLEGRLGDDTPVAANHPPSGPSGVGAIQTYSGLLFKNSTQAQDLAALKFHHENRFVRGVRLQLPNYRMLEPAFQEYFAVVIDPSENTRGWDWTEVYNDVAGREFFCTGMGMQFGEGYILVNVDGELSLFGGGRKTWTPSSDTRPWTDVPGYDQCPGDGATGTEV